MAYRAIPQASAIPQDHIITGYDPGFSSMEQQQQEQLHYQQQLQQDQTLYQQPPQQQQQQFQQPQTIPSFSVPRKPVSPSYKIKEQEPSLTSTTRDYPPPPGWPAHPQILGRRGSIAAWLPLRLWDVALALAPMSFIVLAILALYLDFQPVSAYGEKVVEATRLGPTVFPIIFAAIASRFFRNYARWKAEQREGIGLATLEQILGSQSFAGTFERAVFLRTNMLMAIVTLMVWAMSPIGGQSSSRLLFRDVRVDATPMTLFYPNNSATMSWVDSASGLDDVEAILSTMYAASLLTSPAMKAALTDMWDRPKIPKWNRSAAYDLDADGWRAVDRQALVDGAHDFTSLLGLKMEGFTLESDVSYDVTVESSYIDFDCTVLADGVVRNKTEDVVPASRLNVTSLFPLISGSQVTQTPLAAKFEAPGTNVSVGQWKVSNSAEPLSLLIALRALAHGTEDPTSAVSYFECAATPVIVQTQLRCGPDPSTVCSAQRQRRMHASEPAAFVWPNNLGFVAMHNMMVSWQRASLAIDHLIASATEYYLHGDTVLFQTGSILFWNTTDMGIFSRRMTTAFNTLWQGSLDPFNATTASLRTLTDGDDPAQVAAANEADSNGNIASGSASTATTGRVLSYEALNETFTEAVTIRAIIPADATKTRKTDVYRANHYWIGILIAATVVLELIAIASAAFEFITLAPDVLAYASSMVRDNVFVPQPATGSALHGTERSRLLKDMRVQIADVWPEKEVGYVAFSAVGEGPPWRRLTRDRVYR